VLDNRQIPPLMWKVRGLVDNTPVVRWCFSMERQPCSYLLSPMNTLWSLSSSSCCDCEGSMVSQRFEPFCLYNGFHLSKWHEKKGKAYINIRKWEFTVKLWTRSGICFWHIFYMKIFDEFSRRVFCREGRRRGQSSLHTFKRFHKKKLKWENVKIRRLWIKI
jgi:hypothetical protein